MSASLRAGAVSAGMLKTGAQKRHRNEDSHRNIAAHFCRCFRMVCEIDRNMAELGFSPFHIPKGGLEGGLKRWAKRWTGAP
jgi:hypothetical protein